MSDFSSDISSCISSLAKVKASNDELELINIAKYTTDEEIENLVKYWFAYLPILYKSTLEATSDCILLYDFHHPDRFLHKLTKSVLTACFIKAGPIFCNILLDMGIKFYVNLYNNYIEIETGQLLNLIERYKVLT